ncbi:DUF2510 domain-containing protein [Microbacterium xanthum]|uniref:DUF2510 domain-containing protein n=1 Tax=Microbacterium xanthum TaxID=3079794 RepID=UPI002AD59A62|nr:MULTISPECIES: DUF2510 domain-containing protein [unclassified Microbacterium]MDZ8171788.1 DUF2510 domain-containing protein [Microbacterium sp. KSW-48]MDZ8200109.1 DUF2510 domain-containing protein [Microbacterium sp. SSW1-59]
MTATPPGWYDDGHGALRWWDGIQWTEHVHVAEPIETAAPVAHDGGEPVDTRPEAPASPDADALVSGQPPEGYPGAGVGGAFISATEPKTSRLWIVWVVVGVVLLGIVALAAVFIPLALGMMQGGGSSAGDSPDERAAVATVQTYDDAWRTGDCDAYEASTTESFRDYLGIPDCESFQTSAAEFGATTSGYELTVTSIDTDGAQIVLQTRETYLSSVDEAGAPLPEPEPARDDYTYVLVAEGDAWLIDDASVE